MAWTCQRSGACCTHPQYVVMTYAERRALERVAGTRVLRWKYHPHPRFTKLVAGPCPFLNGLNECGAYEARPYQCRRFACMRDSLDQPWNESWRPEHNEELMQIQASAQPWALAHGWKETDCDS